MQLVELGGSLIAECRMLALPVIKHFDVLEDRLLDLLPGLETAMMDQLRFEGMEEALGRGVGAIVKSGVREF